MNKLRQEYCEENGLNYIKPENTEMKDYILWLEKRIEALEAGLIRYMRLEEFLLKENIELTFTLTSKKDEN